MPRGSLLRAGGLQPVQAGEAPGGRPAAWWGLWRGPRAPRRTAAAGAGREGGGRQHSPGQTPPSKLTPTDGVRIALVLTPPPPAGGDGGTPSPGHYDWAATAASLRLVIRPPSGAERTLELAAPPRNNRLPAGHVHTLVVSGEGLQQRSGTLPWKSPISGAFAASGLLRRRVARAQQVGRRAARGGRRLGRAVPPGDRWERIGPGTVALDAAPRPVPPYTVRSRAEGPLSERKEGR